jgi:hypothetical protein
LPLRLAFETGIPIGHIPPSSANAVGKPRIAAKEEITENPGA